MRIFIKFLIGLCTVATAILATAAPLVSDLAVPRFRKGIWATKHYQDVAGSPSRQDRENILDECVDPAESIRRGLLSGEKAGCELKIEDSKIPHRFIYLSSCPGGTVRLIVETASPTEYKITTTFPQARHVQIGHWVRDCPSASNLPPDMTTPTALPPSGDVVPHAISTCSKTRFDTGMNTTSNPDQHWLGPRN